jgi:hypothetical protein
MTITNVTHAAGLGSTRKFEGATLFGSSIFHHTTIRLEIHRATIQRDLNSDWIHPESSLIEIEMSPTQFADAITSAGNASGTPVTITSLRGERVPEPPFTNKRLQFDSEFEKDLEMVASKTNEFYIAIDKILAKPHLGKKDREDIKEQVEFIQQAIASNLPFVKKQFSEQMDATVSEAKGEIEVFLGMKLRTLGLEGFKKELAKLRSNEVMQLSTQSTER